MKTPVRNIFLFIFFVCVHTVYSQNIKITEKGIEGYFRGEHTRGSDFLSELSAIGAIELEDMFLFRGGLSLGRTIIDTEINTLLSVQYAPFKNIPLSFSVSYIYNGLPEYKANTHSLFPFISYKAERAGISLGVNLRFSSFFGGAAQFESMLAFYGYFYLINGYTIRFGIGGGTFNDFEVKNLGAYSLSLLASIRLNDSWLIVNDIEFMQSGGDGLTTAFYGIAFRTGVKFTW